MKLKIKLLFNEVKDDLYLILFIIIPLIIMLNQTNYQKIIFLFLIFLFFSITIYKYRRKIIFIAATICLVLLTLIIINEIKYRRSRSMFENNDFSDICVVCDLTEYENYQRVTFIKNKIRFIGTLKNQDIQKKLLVGSKVKLIGKLVLPNDFREDEDFSYQKYLKEQKIVGMIEIRKIEIIDNRVFLRIYSYKNINLLLKRLIDVNHPYESKTFLKTLVLGSNDLNAEIKTNLNLLGISHLFVVSGMHFSFLILFIDLVLRIKIFDNVKNKKTIKIILLFLYCLITKFTVSITRCFIQTIIKMNNKKLDLGKFNQFSLSFIIAIMIRPFDIYSVSFALTYIISGGIALTTELLEKNKNYLSKMIGLTILVNLLVLPILSNLSGNINFLVVLFNLIFIPLITYILFPFSFITTIFPIFNKIYYFLYIVFTKIIILINNLSVVKKCNFILPKVPIWFLLIYYILFVFLLKSFYQPKRKKHIKCFISLVMVLIIWNNFGYFNLKNKCSFINVKVGDATLIREKFNRKVILIDTGRSDEIINYLKKTGIKRIDCLIISHPDEDHFGQIKNLLDNFRVKQIMVSEYDNKTPEFANKKIIKIMKAGMIINIGNSVIECIGPIKDYKNSNDNSLVFIFKFKNKSILFTGDIGRNAEIDLINKYRIKVDILKVSHHGSKNSSSKEFLNKISFKYGIAMNGYQNNYGFPSPELVSRFKKEELYNTINYGTITISLD